jgi:2-phospho-L-lactate guanylyltransferase
MRRPDVHVIIPVKAPGRAKGRLARVLSRDTRRELADAMLRDVVRAVRATPSVKRLWVVSYGRSVLSDAEALGATPLKEKFDMGLNRALRFATTRAMAQGAERLLILPSDVPLVRAADLESLLRRDRRHGAKGRYVRLVPSKEGTGTNALLRVPPNVIPPRFGDDSLRRHTREALRRSVPLRQQRIARIALDIDTPKDLLALLARDAAGHTARLLVRLGLL